MSAGERREGGLYRGRRAERLGPGRGWMWVRHLDVTMDRGAGFDGWYARAAPSPGGFD